MKFFCQWNIRIIISFLLFISTLTFTWSQCNPPDQLPTNDCSTAPLICLQDACYNTTNDAVFGWNGFCGPQTAIHNPQYFEVIPTAEHVVINIHVDNCDSGTSLQAAFLATCPWNIIDVLDCREGAPGITMVLDVDNLVIGQSYWIVVDGNAGSICQYTFTSVTGLSMPEIEGELDPEQTFVSEEIVCQGYDNLGLVTGPALPNAHGYIWELWDDLIVTSTLPETIIDIPNNAPPGLWDICVRGFSGCDTTENTVCVQIEIVELDDIIKDTSIFCPNVFPFMWFDVMIFEPGIYTQTFEDSNGCLNDSIWTVESFPGSELGMIDTTHCGTDFAYEGLSFDQSGTYLLTSPELDVYGCDSFVELNLRLEYADVIIEHICVSGQQMLSANVLELLPPNDTLFFEWYDCDYSDLLSTNQQLTIDTTGCYCLVYNSGACTDTICYTYITDPCVTACNLVTDKACTSDSVLFSYSGMVSADAIFNWIITIPGGDQVVFTGSDSIVYNLDSVGCYRASLTITDDSTSITCIDSVCVDPQATASICCDGVICNDCGEIIFTLTGNAPWTVVLTNGVTIDTIQGILTSPYFHEVCQPDGSSVYYTLLEVTESGSVCPGEFPTFPQILIHSPAQPIPEIIPSDSILCADPGFFDYAWYACDSTGILADTVCFVPPSSGCYCVEVTDKWGCRLTACTDFISGTDGQTGNDGISLYPNPAKDFLQIHFTGNVPLPVEWKIYDLTGILCVEGIISENGTQLDLTKLSTGLYFISVMDSNKKRNVFKIIRA